MAGWPRSRLAPISVNSSRISALLHHGPPGLTLVDRTAAAKAIGVGSTTPQTPAHSGVNHRASPDTVTGHPTNPTVMAMFSTSILTTSTMMENNPGPRTSSASFLPLPTHFAFPQPSPTEALLPFGTPSSPARALIPMRMVYPSSVVSQIRMCL